MEEKPTGFYEMHGRELHGKAKNNAKNLSVPVVLAVDIYVSYFNLPGSIHDSRFETTPHVPLLIATVLAAAVGAFHHFSWNEMLEGITGAITAALPAMRRRLMRVLSPKLEGTLIYTGDVVRAISVRVRTAPTWQEGNGLYPAFTLQLAALDPYWRDAGDTVTHIALWLGMFEFPLPDGLEIIDGQWQVGQRSPSLIVSLINQGDVSAGLEITFRAWAPSAPPPWWT